MTPKNRRRISTNNMKAVRKIVQIRPEGDARRRKEIERKQKTKDRETSPRCWFVFISRASIGKEKRGPETLRNVRSVLDSSFHLRSIRRISAYRQGATIATEAISYSRLVVALTSKRGRKIASTRFCRARVSS